MPPIADPRRLHRFVLPALVVTLGVACARPARAGEATGRVTQAIQGGLADTTSTWVLGIVNQHYGTACTGSLIAPNLLMTTRHCIDFPASTGVDCATTRFSSDARPDEIFVATCPDIHDLGNSAGCDWHLGAAIYRPTNPLFCDNDIALVRLTKAIDGDKATPAIPSLDALATGQGELFATFTGIGYGATDSTSSDWGARRRVAGMSVTCVESEQDCSAIASGTVVSSREFVSTTGGLCEGDSGGPATFSDPGSLPIVFGIASRAFLRGGSCESTTYTRVDSWADLIRGAARDAAMIGGYAVPSWANSAAVSLGGPCAADAACSTGRCLGGRCSRACDVAASDACGQGFQCASGLCKGTSVAIAPAEEVAGGGCSTSATGARGAMGVDDAFLLCSLALVVATFRRRLGKHDKPAHGARSLGS